LDTLAILSKTVKVSEKIDTVEKIDLEIEGVFGNTFSVSELA
jgi:hypothetical protein